MKFCTNMQPPVSVSWFFNKDLSIPFVFVLTPYKLCLCSGPQQCSSYVYVLSGSCGEPISSRHAITFLPHSSRSLFNLGGRSRSSTRKNAMARGWDFFPGTVRRSGGEKHNGIKQPAEKYGQKNGPRFGHRLPLLHTIARGVSERGPRRTARTSTAKSCLGKCSVG